MSVEQGSSEAGKSEQLGAGHVSGHELIGVDTVPTREEREDEERYQRWLRCGACKQVGRKAIDQCAFDIAPGMRSAIAASMLMKTCQLVIDGNAQLGPYDRRTPIPVHGVRSS